MVLDGIMVLTNNQCHGSNTCHGVSPCYVLTWYLDQVTWLLSPSLSSSNRVDGLSMLSYKVKDHLEMNIHVPTGHIASLVFLSKIIDTSAIFQLSRLLQNPSSLGSPLNFSVNWLGIPTNLP